MAFEAICRRLTFSSMREMYNCAANKQAYPWELPTSQQPRAWRNSRLRAVLQPCLSRRAAERPSAQQLQQCIMGLGQATTLAAAGEGNSREVGAAHEA